MTKSNIISVFVRIRTNLKILLIAVKIIFVLLLGIYLSPVAFADTEGNSPSITPYLQEFSKKITEFRLDNGLKFILLENHTAPVVSFVTYADVGGVNEPDGKTGVAHFLEHLAFKGTQEIGTTNYLAEEKLLDNLDEIFAEIKTNKSPENLQKLETKYQEVQSKASQYVKQNEFGEIVETQGGVGLNAATSTESTTYFYSFPANKLELWMSLESERFLEPVFREFEKEKQVILEERRLRTDNSPIGLMLEDFLAKAFSEHPYKRPVIGYEEDIVNLDREDVKDFFNTYYVPSSLTIAIVGDINPQQVQQLAQVYFGRFPAKPAPPKITIVEPPQQKTREVTLKLASKPWYLEGYHIPSIKDPDNVVYEMISSILSDGRTSRLYQSLVEKKQLALVCQGFSGFPGEKYPNLIVFYAQTAPNHNVDEVAVALEQEIERLKTDLVSVSELERVKTQARAQLLRSLDSNMGMAKLLTQYQVKTGDWRHLFQELDAIALVTPADIQRVAQATFTPENRTIGRLLTKSTKE